MDTDERLEALEARLAHAEGELRSTQERVRHLQRSNHRLAVSCRLSGFAALLVVIAALAVGGTQAGGADALGEHAVRIKAPFSVVGRGNKLLFQVTEIPGAGGSLRLLDQNGK